MEKNTTSCGFVFNCCIWLFDKLIGSSVMGIFKIGSSILLCTVPSFVCLFSSSISSRSDSCGNSDGLTSMDILSSAMSSSDGLMLGTLLDLLIFISIRDNASALVLLLPCL